MTTFLEQSLSLDGFAAGPQIGPEHPLGIGGDALHTWLDSDHEADRAAAAAVFAATGAFVLGRRMFDVGIDLWGDDGAFGTPCFVVTSRPREPLVKGPTTFTFVPGGVEPAIEAARAVAGSADVCIAGGPTIAREALEAGLVDELHLHVAPLVLGAGTRLFGEGEPTALERTAVAAGRDVTHLTLRVAG